MKISYSNIHAGLRKEMEHESKHHIEKLNRLLKRYSPDLVKLHGILGKTPRKAGYDLSLNLILPTGTLHATGNGADVRASAKEAFTEIVDQLKKHQQKLRKDYVWKRKRGGALLKARQVPSAD
ncbi:MAG TPA: HPF/RaiA family ribosome-associated protein [Candidatus Acidoferrum sp.]|nr:HPF/RaiA family ribosome-associated protein [Candidatus Acidoferrum sp.]